MGSLPPVFLFFPPFHLLVLFSFQQTSKALYPLPSSFSFPLPPPLNFLILFGSLTFAFLFPSFYQLFYLSIDNFSYTLFFPFHVFLIFLLIFFILSVLSTVTFSLSFASLLPTSYVNFCLSKPVFLFFFHCLFVLSICYFLFHNNNSLNSLPAYFCFLVSFAFVSLFFPTTFPTLRSFFLLFPPPPNLFLFYFTLCSILL